MNDEAEKVNIIRCEKDELNDELKRQITELERLLQISDSRGDNYQEECYRLQRLVQELNYKNKKLEENLKCATHKCNDNYTKDIICKRFTSDCLEIYVRSANVIQNEELTDINELCKYSPSRFLEIPYIGQKTVYDIIEELDRYHLRLSIRSTFDNNIYLQFYKNRKRFDK